MAKHVLVIDDEIDIRIFFSTLLKSNGYKVSMAEDGEEGMQKIQADKPDLVALDIMMPKESGIKAYRKIKTDPKLKSIKVLVVSAMAKKTFLHSQKMLDQFRSQEVPEPEGYIEKPPEPEELLEEVERILG